MKSVHPIKANPSNAILVVANMQNDFCKPGGAIYDERSPKEMPGVIQTIRSLAGQARSVGIPILHLQSVRTFKEAEFTTYGHKPYVKEGSWGAEIVDELKPHPTDHIVPVWHLEPFIDPKLDYLIQGMIEAPTKCHAIIVGGDIGGFGFVTVIGFYMRGFWTVVPIDAFYGDQATRDFALNGRFSATSQKSVFLSRSDLIQFSKTPSPGVTGLVPGE